MKQLFLLFFLTLFGSLAAMAQSGEIQGKVTDAKNGEPLPFVNVSVSINGSMAGAQTDFDGQYSIKPIPPGEYSVKASLVGYNSQQTDKVLVRSDKITFLDMQISESSNVLDVVEIVAYKVPLLQADETATGGTITKEDIQNLPTRNVASIASQTAGVFQADEGSGLNVRGSRSESTDYYIDGIKVRGGATLPASAIEQLTVVTGGLPARYGDATGGIINITTRGPSSQFSGGVELSSSKFLEPYNYNLANFSLAGPIIKIGKADKRRTLLGFFISGEYLHETDDDPSSLGIWKAKDDVLTNIIANPLVPSQTGSGFETAASLLTAENFEKIRIKQNVTKDDINFAGKLDFQPVQGINVTFGGNYSYSNGGAAGRSGGYRDFMRRYELFNWDHSPLVNSNVYRIYGRFTQRFANAKVENTEESRAKKQSPLQNAYYSVQFDYTRSSSSQQDPIFGDNLFDYGYVGKFNTTIAPTYGTEELKYGSITFNSYALNGYADTLVTYEPGGVNPVKDAHNAAYFALAGDDKDNYYSNIFQILNNKGYINGGLTPASLFATNSLWYVPGTHWNSYGYNQDNQYRLTFNGSFDLKKSGGSDRNKHAIEFGFEYEQRVDRSFFLNPDQLWDFMYDNIARYGNGIELDKENPYLLIDGQNVTLADYIAGQQANGQPFSEYDTILYNVVKTTDSYFDRKFREKFGLGALDYADVFSKGSDEYTLDMFSPDELFNDGQNTNYTYNGYDYLGQKTSEQPDFQDFWTAKNAEGMFTRPLGAFRPVYMAGFIQDKFAFKDLIFNVGVRIDRFDANQKTPKDIYSPLYGTRKAGEVSEFGAHPSTIGDDFVVYVDDALNPSAIKGYRDGDTWYNKDGLAVVDPIVLQSGTSVTPYLLPGQDISGDGYRTPEYNTSLAFEDYKPQISVMPRIAFSFSISDNAIFFAHYDVLTQRPQDRFQPTAKDYFYFNQTVQAGQIENANLRPERTIDYQIGFKQKLSNSSALTLSGFYRELKDMVQLRTILYAYPFNYGTYGNIDFGTVKGLELAYDLRRTQNLRMTFSYTLQFADGTGSGDRSQINLLSAGRPNLRSIFPLSYDSRHLFNVNLDYSFADGKDYNGPKLFGKDILANTGLNVVFRARSGTPYTQQLNATSEGQFGVQTKSQLEGTINGSRLPFTSRIDVRLEKEFKFKLNKKAKEPNSFSVYAIAQNVLDARNIINVYSYTGSADDDGFVASLGGADVTGQAFSDQYLLKVQNPNNFSIPRRIRVGLIYNF
jgi:hypothetical protein